MADWRIKLEESYELFAADLANLIEQTPILISEADVPPLSGVYLFEFERKVTYVGEEKGSGGLRDRICRKHVSGDESHALQRAFQTRFPDRLARREFLRQHVHVKWVVIDDVDCIAIVEQIAIWLFKPLWNAL